MSKFGSRALLPAPEPSPICQTKLISGSGEVLNQCTKEYGHEGGCRLSMFPCKQKISNTLGAINPNTPKES